MLSLTLLLDLSVIKMVVEGESFRMVASLSIEMCSSTSNLPCEIPLLNKLGVMRGSTENRVK